MVQPRSASQAEAVHDPACINILQTIGKKMGPVSLEDIVMAKRLHDANTKAIQVTDRLFKSLDTLLFSPL